MSDRRDVVDHPVVDAHGQPVFAWLQYPQIMPVLSHEAVTGPRRSPVDPDIRLPHRPLDSQRRDPPRPARGHVEFALVPGRPHEQVAAHEVAVLVGPGRVLDPGEPRRDRERRGVEHRLRIQCEAEPGAVGRVRQDDPVVACQRLRRPA